ncbi:MAG TPA: phosphodiesterase [Pseudomonas xinjiangensis]|uniref:Phosphodiesterase n=1 Tax=Halopseudomonas xinjiangensis TaxID=487184 RepID=A0A7V1BR00_9GAMM|nr:phosphodiesterase [Halopseudomonas xinjiangensis]HEC46762.1 phosphodiesterase [Halopseudomonas xinjiangensis]
MVSLPLSVVLFASQGVTAETITFPLGQQAGAKRLDLPQRGASTTQVEQHYGAPANQHAAVGQPPISRWDYSDFSVYFEYDKVVHSVHKHVPGAIGQK